MNAAPKKCFTLLTGLTLALVLSPLGTAFGHEKPDRHPTVTAVTGQSDWSIVPPSFIPEYVSADDDGNLTIRRMPLAGNFALSGDGSTIDGTIKGILNADLDPSFSGPIYGPLVVSRKIKGRDIVIFEGFFFGRATGGLSSGQILLHGRGQFADVTITVAFLETGATTETFTLTGHLFDPHND